MRYTQLIHVWFVHLYLNIYDGFPGHVTLTLFFSISDCVPLDVDPESKPIDVASMFNLGQDSLEEVDRSQYTGGLRHK